MKSESVWDLRSMENYAETWMLSWKSLIKSLGGNK